MYDIIFYIFAAICILSAIMVVFVRNISHAAFALLFTFFGIAGLYVMLGADFVGISQLLIYVGGILVLFLFGMMLTTNIDKLREERTEFGQLFFGVIGACAMVTLLVTAIWNVKAWAPRSPQNPGGVVLAVIPEGSNTTSIIGQLFMGDFALLFIASSIAILVALVGAAMIARNDKMSAGEATERM